MTQWTPSNRAARFVAHRVLKGYRTGQILIATHEEMACVDACLLKWLSPNLRRKVGALWVVHGDVLVNIARKVDQAAYSPSSSKVTEEVLRALCA